ncbi:FAD-binding and (Fe-S)-binding domain-containing protein [Brevibacterium sp. CT2-23B]|uniref:FAD-binding and (Fe-S)-binding domain-containing protein n=1 Tax=Brevibacterium sp. CT2-23B TaxID=2729630 RepID=UPI0015578859|nr:FAD-binding and (Fe-S)-binding domain-containing protein [Brevibacterium sp. CT2-23B]
MSADTTADTNTDVTDVVTDLTRSIAGTVDTSPRRLAEYAVDASNYRVVPQVVAFPKSTADVVSVLDVARSHRVPITSRGGGTSQAGNSIGTGIVIDFSRHLNHILDIDPTAKTARVEPGVLMSELQKAGKPHGLTFGPDPSTKNRATIAGMIGNNSCGPHAISAGRTVDNIVEMTALDGTGRSFLAGAGLDPIPGLAEVAGRHLGVIRTEFGRFSRQASAYAMEHLLPENGPNLAKFLVGSEGTLSTITEAVVSLGDLPNSPTVLVLGYPDMFEAADAVPRVLPHGPLAVEGIDSRLMDMVRNHKGKDAVPELPAGKGWLLIEVAGATADEAVANAQIIAAEAGTDHFRILPAGKEASTLWGIRADAGGLAGRTEDGDPAWTGWEDAAVPPEVLGDYLRDQDELMASYGVRGLPYGHFGDGCVHMRTDFPFDRPDGIDVFHDFVMEAGRLVTKYGGSASGEHGDGRARSELLGLQHSDEAIAALGEVKRLFDPNSLLNPGIIVDPLPIISDLRRPQSISIGTAGGFSFAHDKGSFTSAVHRCVGVGKCRADTSGSGGFMCPSYLATKDEKDSTRGRARVLQEVTNGGLINAFDSAEVAESLDLCLSCKACSSDCPAGVDMAQYKSEVLHRTYRGRLRPLAHYSLGWLPTWGRLLTAVPGVSALANAALGFRPLAKLVLTGGGMDPRRQMVRFNDRRFSRWAKSRISPAEARGASAADRDALVADEYVSTTSASKKQVLLWADSFTEYLSDVGARTAVDLLESTGFEILLPQQQACCGLTLISTGQLDAAKRKLESTMAILDPYARKGIPIVGIEPSCTAVLRSDLGDLFPDDERARRIAAATSTLAEVLVDAQVDVPDLTGRTVVVQPHCHQHSVMGFAADRALLERTGATVRELAGCCGLAGNFGMEAGHYETSVAVAENALLPALRDAPENSIYLADGFSCRTQAADLANVNGMTLPQLLTGEASKPGHSARASRLPEAVEA